ncbi:DUF4350 domain-containing protein [Hymenobacter arizonensis]|uniref:DUF4350 domain-containing protein n=1 Tax=Hymenobacter arizonensis TaxID=1227077 RepID=A0A1I6AWF7_HYMAR|nr:DUF4350 domain-containing protein [Hymenobacter arizonensis]SFQ72959.1 protein of unknown function [Hymenobacter arizonensis]
MPQLTTFRLYLLGIAVLFAGYVTLEYNRPKPVDWRPTYANKDKIPYGTYALYDQLPNLLGTDSIVAVRLPVYSQLTGRALAQTTEGATPPESDARYQRAQDSYGSVELPRGSGPSNYLFVNDGFEVSPLDLRTLLKYVAAGNDVFVATQSIGSVRGSKLLRDSLGLDLKETDLATHKGPKGFPVVDSVDLRFTNPALAKAHIRLPGTALRHYLAVDSGRVGRTLATNDAGQAVFIRLDHGRGHFYFCLAPVAFTNYYLLRPRTTAFAAAALAYLPARRTWWDEFQKQGPLGNQSLLRVVFAHDALRVAYYLMLAGGLLFVLTAARRRQRIIPIIKALPNNTLAFTRTVASLYQQGSSHALIAEKKVGLFMDYLRTRFHESNPDFGDAEFRERLSQKSGVARPRVDELLRVVNFARTAPQMNDRELLSLSKALSDFKREADH